jgi:NTP pyrophosphatase (non-canonical NTP hydrolase)
MDIREMQKKVYENKIKHGFNTTNVEREFCLLYGEVGEAYEAWIKKHDNMAEELADVAIYLMGLSEIVGVDLQKEVERKMAINEKREYVMVNGVLVKKGSKDDTSSSN